MVQGDRREARQVSIKVMASNLRPKDGAKHGGLIAVALREQNRLENNALLLPNVVTAEARQADTAATGLVPLPQETTGYAANLVVGGKPLAAVLPLHSSSYSVTMRVPVVSESRVKGPSQYPFTSDSRGAVRND